MRCGLSRHLATSMVSKLLRMRHTRSALYQTKPVGNCFYSDAVVFSFHPVKIITSGEGGMVTTNNEELAAVLEMLRVMELPEIQASC